MNKSALLIALTLALSASVASAADQLASQPASPPSAAPTDGTVQPADSGEPHGTTSCLRETGSLIRLDHEGCLNGGPGRSYSRDALDDQAGTSAADLLRYDPSVTISGPHH